MIFYSNLNYFFLKIVKNFLSKSKIEKNLVLNLEKKFTSTHYEYEGLFLKKILNNKNINFSESIKQILFEKLFWKFRAWSLFHLNKRIIFPLPREIISGIKRTEPINILLSNLLFSLLSIFYLIRSIFFLISYIFKNLFILNDDDRSYVDIKTIFFCNVKKENVSKNFNDETFVSWFNKNFYLNEKKIFFTTLENPNINNLQIVKNSSQIPNIGFHYNLLILLFKSILMYLYFFKNFFLNKPLYFFMSEEIMKALIFSIMPKKKICDEYVFLNRTYIYRPLWTYIAEERKSLITLVFFSTNQGRYTEGNSWTGISWSRFYIWDKIQLNFLEKYNSIKAKYYQFNYIPMCDDYNISHIPYSDICIFDDAPLSLLHTALYGQIDSNYNFNCCLSFFDDILEIASKYNLSINFKIKREMKSIHKGYLKKIKNSKYKKIQLIDANVAPKRVIEKSKLVISYPFSTTGLIAKNFAKEVIYYSPHDIDDSFKVYTRDIKTIFNKINLEYFIKSKFN